MGQSQNKGCPKPPLQSHDLQAELVNAIRGMPAQEEAPPSPTGLIPVRVHRGVCSRSPRPCWDAQTHVPTVMKVL